MRTALALLGLKAITVAQLDTTPANLELPKPALDVELRKQLWKLFEELTGVPYPETR